MADSSRAWPGAVRTLVVCLALAAGCTTAKPAPDRPIRVAVGPIVMEAPVSSSTKIHSFDEAPTPEREPIVRAELIADIEAKSQRILTEGLREQGLFQVTPFSETRRMLADLMPSGSSFGPVQIESLANEAAVDVVITGRILVYGTVPAKYWLSTYAVSETGQLIAVSVLSGGNPIVIGAYIGYDILTDIPSWTGGTYMFGLAYRPVFIEVEATQVGTCPRQIWKKKEIVVIAFRELAEYSWRDRWKKEIQLGVNLRRALTGIAESAARTLRLQPCQTSHLVAIPNRSPGGHTTEVSTDSPTGPFRMVEPSDHAYDVPQDHLEATKNADDERTRSLSCPRATRQSDLPQRSAC